MCIYILQEVLGAASMFYSLVWQGRGCNFGHMVIYFHTVQRNRLRPVWPHQGGARVTPLQQQYDSTRHIYLNFVPAVWWHHWCQQMIHCQLQGKNRRGGEVPYGDTEGFFLPSAGEPWPYYHTFEVEMTSLNWFTKATYRNQCNLFFFFFILSAVTFASSIHLQQRFSDLAGVGERASFWQHICLLVFASVILYFLLSITRGESLPS